MRRGLVASRDDARDVIEAGLVTVAGAPADKESRLVGAGETIIVSAGGPRFVSRAGAKLDAALDEFGIDVTGKRVLDAGSSTGGFVDCLLQRGAAEVIAVDVGYGQLHERLRADQRVLVRERTNVRSLDSGSLGGQVDIVTADLSFISLRAVAPALVGATSPGGDLVLLVKPQFEARRNEADRSRGVIRDPGVWRRVLNEVIAAMSDLGATIIGGMPSPIRGADGNVEFVLHVRAGVAGAIDGRPAEPALLDVDAIIRRVPGEGA